jgi:PAS domain S-box-containing protein
MSGLVEAFGRFANLFQEPILLVSSAGHLCAANSAAAHSLVPGARFNSDARLFDFIENPAEEVRSYLKLCARSVDPIPGKLTFRTTKLAQQAVRCSGCAFRGFDDQHNPLIVLRFATAENPTSRFIALNQQLELQRREIARRLVAEAEAHRRHELLQVTLKSIGDAVIATDTEGRVTFLNQVAADLMGISSSSALGQPIDAVFVLRNEHTGARVENPVAKVLRDGGVVGLANHTELIRPDGSTIPIDDSGAPIRDAEGRLLGAIVVFHEISESRRLQRELIQKTQALEEADLRKETLLASLRESEERFRLLANTIPQLAWMADPDGSIFWYNQGWYDYTGTTLEQMHGWGWESVHDPDVLPSVVERWRASLETGLPFEMVFPLKAADGQFRPFLTRVNPLRNDQGRILYWFGTNTDIGEIKRMEDALRDADRRKDEFLATLAHELRNPLAPIRNSLEILKMPHVGAAVLQQTRAMMARQVDHLVRLVDDLLDVSRVMRGKIDLRREPVELATVVARAVETVKPLIEVQGHRLELSMPESSLLVDVDLVRMTQVIGNLLTNAAKYTEARGLISVSADIEGEQVALRVKDNGIGIAPDLLPHIFDLFVQADHASTKAQGGLGIGLTLARNLVRMHGGTIEASSSGLGAGSEFVVRMPLVSQPQREAPTDPSPAFSREVNASGKRLLVVDDNQDAAMSLAALLQLQGHDVCVAHDGRSALTSFQSHCPEIVFLDIGMPGMDGYTVARHMREVAGSKSVVIAALTGWGQEADRRRTTEAGFDHHLVKPVDFDVLKQLLART